MGNVIVEQQRKAHAAVSNEVARLQRAKKNYEAAKRQLERVQRSWQRTFDAVESIVHECADITSRPGQGERVTNIKLRGDTFFVSTAWTKLPIRVPLRFLGMSRAARRAIVEREHAAFSRQHLQALAAPTNSARVVTLAEEVLAESVSCETAGPCPSCDGTCHGDVLEGF